MEIDKKGKYNYVVEPFHVDYTGKLTWGVLGNQLLNCAGFHSTDRGFGIGSLNEEDYTWVLSRLAVEMKQMPHQYDKYSIETWMENVYRLFTDRNFVIRNENGDEIGYASSVWAMISLQTRKPANLLTLHDGGIANFALEETCPIAKPSRIKVVATEATATYQVKYSDIDINGHTNSVKTIEHILDLFPYDNYKKGIERFEIAYVAESYFGDVLHFYVDNLDEKDYAIEIRRNNDNVVCRSKVKFS